MKSRAVWKGTHFTLWRPRPAISPKPFEWRIVISRKVVRLATQRNRWKRRIREVLRHHKALLPAEVPLVLKVHWAGDSPSYAEIEKEITDLLKKSGSS